MVRRPLGLITIEAELQRNLDGIAYLYEQRQIGLPKLRLMAERAQVGALAEMFPGYRIWREDLAGRIRFVARAELAGLHPHTLVTVNPRELRDALLAALAASVQDDDSDL